MTKKTYIDPSVMVASIAPVTFVCASPDVVSSGDVEEIGYGGVDEEGTIEPSARRHRDVWAEKEEDEE